MRLRHGLQYSGEPEDVWEKLVSADQLHRLWGFTEGSIETRLEPGRAFSFLLGTGEKSSQERYESQVRDFHPARSMSWVLADPFGSLSIAVDFRIQRTSEGQVLFRLSAQSQRIWPLYKVAKETCFFGALEAFYQTLLTVLNGAEEITQAS